MNVLLKTTGIFLLVLITSFCYGQDLSVTAKINPSDGCDLTNSEPVGVVIYNGNATAVAPNTVTVNYTVNGGAVVQQPLTALLTGNATWNFNFTNPANNADLSACGTHEVKIWIVRATDLNQNNDTITFNVVNDCTIIPGTVINNMTVCETSNLDTVFLDGWSNGTITDWQYSEDNGTSWTGLGGITDTLYEFTNLTTETQYRVLIEGGYCLDDTSAIATVSLQPAPIAGTISGANSVCAAISSGTLTLNGASGSVLRWESSTDGGSTWTTITNTTNTEAYVGLTQTTRYRALVDGGFCPDVFSDTAVIFVETTTIAGLAIEDTTICPETSINLFLDGKLGDVLYWESSNDSLNWQSITNTDTVHNTGVLTANTYYRIIVQNGICLEDTSNVILVTMHPPAVADAGTDVTIDEGDVTTLFGTGGVSGIWYPGTTLSDSTIVNPEASPIVTTSYTYTVINEEGCIDSDQVTVTVIPSEPAYLPFDIKNTITSNQDNYNDFWIIEGVEAFPNTFVAVYNIYGKEIYTSNDYQNDWDGSYKGKQLPNGTYMYVVTPGGSDSKLKGNLTILGNE